MGFCINCGGVMYNCRYTDWVNFREEIAKSAVVFLVNEYDTLLKNGANESYLENQLSKIMEYIDVNNCSTIPDFMYLFENSDMLNTFIYYRLGGVYALLNKSDDDGYYTVGNSIDIVHTFQFIEQFIENDDTKNALVEITKVFQKGIDEKKLVAIY